jgi:hypothetical protein
VNHGQRGAWDIEESIKGGCVVTMNSEGTQTVRSVKGGYLATYFWNSTVGEDCRLPEFVRHMLYEQRNRFRTHFRLHRSYRWGAWGSKVTRVRWSVNRPVLTWFAATWRKGLVAKRVRVCNPSEYLPV